MKGEKIGVIIRDPKGEIRQETKAALHAGKFLVVKNCRHCLPAPEAQKPIVNDSQKSREESQ